MAVAGSSVTQGGAGAPVAHGAWAPGRARGLLLLGAALVVYNVNFREISQTDTIGTRLLPIALIREHRLTLDRFVGNRPPGVELPHWVQEVGGDYLSSYPILPAVLAAPVYLLPMLVVRQESWVLVNALSKLSASLFAALSVLFVYLALRRLGDESAATGLAVVYAVGTSTWSVSSQGLWGHAPAQLFLAIALYCLVRGQEEPRLVYAAGVAAALMVACRLPTGVVALAVLGHAIAQDRARGIKSALLFGLAGFPVAFFNVWYFGSLQGGNAKLMASQASFHSVEGAWSGSVWHGLLGLLVSPSRGLFVYSPVLLAALVGLPGALRGPHAALFRWLAAGFAGSLLVLSKFSAWWAGYSFGPRYLTDFLPLLIVFAIPAWSALGRVRWITVTFLALFAWSVSAQAIGAFCYPSRTAVDWNTSPRDVDHAHERLWDWRDNQLLRTLRNGPRAPGFRDSQ
jgi:hypothetical protein